MIKSESIINTFKGIGYNIKEGFDDETLKSYDSLSFMNFSHPLEEEDHQETISINDDNDNSDFVMEQRDIILHGICL